MAKFWDTKFGSKLKGAGNWILNTLDEMKVPILSQVAGMATGLLGSSLQKSTVNNRMSGAEREAFNLSAQEAQKAREWNMQMDNTKYQRQVTDMQNAGINPALAMNGGVSTQATSNVAASASTQQAPMMSVADFATLASNLKSAEADRGVKKAQEGLYKEEQRGERINNNVDEIMLLDERIASLEESRSRTGVNEELKKKYTQEIENLKVDKAILEEELTLRKDQHEINDYIKQKMRIELDFLPEQLRASIAVDWAQAGLDRAAADVKIAELESWDWNNRQLVTYSYARSVGAKIHFGLFKKFEAGGGSNVGFDESTQGLLIFDRKTKEYQFIPTYGDFKDSKEDYKEDKKEGNKQERKENRAENKAKRQERREPVKQAIVDGVVKLGGAK